MRPPLLFHNGDGAVLRVALVAVANRFGHAQAVGTWLAGTSRSGRAPLLRHREGPVGGKRVDEIAADIGDRSTGLLREGVGVTHDHDA